MLLNAEGYGSKLFRERQREEREKRRPEMNSEPKSAAACCPVIKTAVLSREEAELGSGPTYMAGILVP